MVYGVWHSAAAFYVCWFAVAPLSPPSASGAVVDLAGAGSAVFVCMVLVVTLKLCTRTRNWNWITYLTYGLSLATLLPFIFVLSMLWPVAGLNSLADMTGVAGALFSAPAFWLAALLLAPAVSLLPDLAVEGFTRYLRPSLVTLLQAGPGLGQGSGGARRRSDPGRACACTCG
jgi:hypothetical protein